VVEANVLRLRIRINKDTPELLERLSGDRATNQEVLYLLRLGLVAESRFASERNFLPLSADTGGLNVMTHASIKEPTESMSLREDGISGELGLSGLVDVDFFTP
jgi:hypothetical protein